MSMIWNKVYLKSAHVCPLQILLMKAIELPSKNYFSAQVSARAFQHAAKDGFQVFLRLNSHLPRPITLSEISVKVISTSGREIYFTSSILEISPRINDIWTHCNTTAPGQYIFESITLSWGKISWTEDFVEMGRKQGLSLYPHG